MAVVFVWVSYGDTRVYRGDTKEDVIDVLNEMNEMAEMYEEKPYDIEKLAARMDTNGVEEMRRRVNMRVNEIAQKSDDDRFDYGSGFFEVETFEE